MIDAPRPRPAGRWLRLLVAALLCLSILTLAASLVSTYRSARPSGLANGLVLSTAALDAPGIREIHPWPSADSGLADDEPVIGVSAGGRCRAYWVGAFTMGHDRHVVDDVLGEVPVSVTHCGFYNCTRAFTGPEQGQPLDLAQGGISAGSLVLRAEGHRYRQDSGAPLDPDAPPFPYAVYPEEVTTWGQWRREHPDTDVYLGLMRAGLSQPVAGG